MADVNTQAANLKTLPLTYRQSLVEQIVRCLRAGDSCSLIGVSGMAKSNLFRHLLLPEAQAQFLGEGWRRYLFVAADAHALAELSEQAAYDLLAERLHAACLLHELPPEITARVEHLSEQIALATTPLVWQRGFRQAVRAVLDGDVNTHLVMLFDQFDEVYQTLPPQFFVNLRAVRDEYKYRVSYLAFTREELPRLNNAPECEEFYELFSANVFGLAPYDQADALGLLARVASRYETSLPPAVSGQLIKLTSGHPGLLKAACLALIKNNVALPDAGEQAIAALLKVDDVRTECAKLWDGISQEEQLALKNLVVHPGALIEQEAARRLRLKHLVTERNATLFPFCEVFAGYLAGQKTASAFPAKIQAGYIRIDTAGEVWVDEQQVIPALTKKELSLLEYLCLKPGHLRTKDEIIAVVYPEEYQVGGSPTDDALNALVKRLRDRLEQTAKRGACIATVRGKGYRLELN